MAAGQLRYFCVPFAPRAAWLIHFLQFSQASQRLRPPGWICFLGLPLLAPGCYNRCCHIFLTVCDFTIPSLYSLVAQSFFARTSHAHRTSSRFGGQRTSRASNHNHHAFFKHPCAPIPCAWGHRCSIGATPSQPSRCLSVAVRQLYDPVGRIAGRSELQRPARRGLQCDTREGSSQPRVHRLQRQHQHVSISLCPRTLNLCAWGDAYLRVS